MFSQPYGSLGMGENNMFASSTYTTSELLTLNRNKLEAMLMQNWMARKVISVISNDMIQNGIRINSNMLEIDVIQYVEQLFDKLHIFKHLEQALQLGFLYGGAGAIILIEGHDLSSPLDYNAIVPGTFKGLYVVDRWQVDPSTTELDNNYGLNFGLPKYYTIINDSTNPLQKKMQQSNPLAGVKIHNSRFIRFIGDSVPYWQRINLDYWGTSILESCMDRILMLDSITYSSIQMMNKTSLRVLKIPGLSQTIGASDNSLELLAKRLKTMQLFQSNESITAIDTDEEIQEFNQTFSGISEMLQEVLFQVAGAVRIPIIKIVGQSPAGLSNTGAYDLQSYYEDINSRQEEYLREPILKLINIIMHNEEIPVPDDIGFTFAPAQTTINIDKSQVAVNYANAISTLVTSGVFSQQIALKEIKSLGEITGIGDSITDEDIELAQDNSVNEINANPQEQEDITRKSEAIIDEYYNSINENRPASIPLKDQQAIMNFYKNNNFEFIPNNSVNDNANSIKAIIKT